MLPRDGLVDVVNAEQVMVDHALNHIENAEADQHRPGEEFPGPPEMRPMRGTPERDQSEHDEDVGRGVEEPVEEGVDLQVLDAVRWIAGARDHVMPLEHLVQHDAVEEPPEAQAEEDAGRDGELPWVVGKVSHERAGRSPETTRRRLRAPPGRLGEDRRRCA